jgi:hypothetical protein
MPVTDVLLQRLRRVLGAEATNDLVTWVDHSTARDIAQLRELADLHYGRFDARLEQRLAESEGRLRTELAQAIAAVRVEMSGLRLEMSALRTDMASQRADLVKWMFIFWAGTVLPLAGLMLALLKFR